MGAGAMMVSVILATAVVLAIIYVVPLVVYGAASALWGLEPPEGVSPGRFLFGVLVTKLGTAVAFVAVFSLTSSVWAGRWLVYGMLWFVMFAASEVGEAISRRTSPTEAVLGVIAEAIYAPASAFAVRALLVD
jgi:hypothetical protein